MRKLEVEIVEFEDDCNWHWRLRDETGAFVADHRVSLDSAVNEYQGFENLYEFLDWHMDPEAQAVHEQEILARVANWIRTEAWGDIAKALLERALDNPLVVLVRIPVSAQILLFRPFELAFSVGCGRQGHDISLIWDSPRDGGPSASDGKRTGDRLRMLALFSAPSDQVALNLRHERRELRRLIDRIGQMAGKAVDLRVLQYGVTKKILEDVLDEGPGWDLIHFSGHGLPEGIVLEQEDGSAELIHSDGFAELLLPAREKLKLVTLSSCQSGGITPAQALRMIGIKEPGAMEDSDPPLAEAEPGALPAVAQGVCQGIGCAVVAMRYPIGDDFAVDFSASLYEGLLTRGHTLPRAMQRALRRAAASGRYSDVSLATPALFGSAASTLTLEPPPASPATFNPSSARLAYFEPEPEHFVGRVRQLARATAALAPHSSQTTVVFHGMAGAGKTACALELSYRHEQGRFEEMAWHRAPSEGQHIEGALAQFALDLEMQLDGFELAHVVDDIDKLKRFLPRVRRLMATRSLLIVLDNVESLLSEGNWRDERWELLIEALISHDGLSRLVLTTRIPPKALLGRDEVLVESIDALSASESALLARQLPNLGALMTGELGPHGPALIRRTLQIVQGNPQLIELADRQATNITTLEQRIAEADRAWANGANLSVFFKSGEPDASIGADDFLRVLESWTLSISATLPPRIRLGFWLLCCLERTDRRLEVINLAWPRIWEAMERDDQPPDPQDVFIRVSAQGLIDLEERNDSQLYRMHPAVEQAERGSIDSEIAAAVDWAMAKFWFSLHRQSIKMEDAAFTAASGMAAAPYLLRCGKYTITVACLENALWADTTPTAVAAALPLLERVVEIAEDPAEERFARAAVAKARAAQHDGDVLPEFEQLMTLAQEDEDFARVATLRSDLLSELIRLGRLKEALELLEAPLDPEVQKVCGDWSPLLDAGRRLQIRQAMGANEEVLAEVEPLLERIEQAEEIQEGEVRVDRRVMRESTLVCATLAAKALRKWDTLLDFNARIRQSAEERGGTELELAKVAFTEHPALIELKRLDACEKLLRHVREVAQREGDLHLLGNVFNAWATLESRRGHTTEALEFDRRSLRMNYMYGEPEAVNIGHHNLATHLEKADGDPREIVAHRMVVALISYMTSSGDLHRDLGALGSTLRDLGTDALPKSFQDLCESLQGFAEVDFDEVFSKLPPRSKTGDEAMEIVETAALELLGRIHSSEEKPESED